MSTKVAPEAEASNGSPNGALVTAADEKRMEAEGEPIDPEIEAKNEARRNKEPFKYCKWVIARPKTAFGIFLGGHIFMLVLTGILVMSGYDLFPIEFQSLPMQLWNDDSYLRQLAWRERDDDAAGLYQDVQDSSGTGGFRTAFIDNLELYYDTKDGNIFTADNLRIIQTIENQLQQVAGYQSTYCQLDASGGCVKPTSIIRYFDGSLNGTVPGLYDPNFTNISGIISLALSMNETKADILFHFGKDYSGYSTSITRSLLPIGWPLSASGSKDDHRTLIQDYLVANFKPVLNDIRKDYKGDPFDFVFYSVQLWLKEVFAQAMNDMMFAIGSLIFIFIYMCFITRSSWIAGLAIFSVICCFVCTNLIYRIVLDFRYIGFFHVLSLFIILGIGADDFFVFYDTWKASGHEHYKSLAHRLSDCYRRAAETMLYTSVTTAVAFFATAFSPLLAVRSFGVFSGVLILVNYISVITYFPTVVIMYHLKFQHWKGPCGCCCSKGEAAHETEHEPIPRTRQNPVVKFFRGPFYRFITHKVARVVILVALAAIVAFFGYWASTLQPDDEEMRVYKDTHVYGKAIDRRRHSFIASEGDSYVNVYLVWGLDNRDLSDCHKTDHECVGTARYDTTFDLSPADAQMAMADFCSRLHNLTAAQIDLYQIRRDPITGALQIDCPITSIQQYLQTEVNRVDNATGLPVYSSAIDLSLALNQTKVTNFMQVHPSIYNTTALPATFSHWFEVLVSYWLSDGYSMQPTTDWHVYKTLVKEMKRDDGSVNLVNNTIGKYYGTQLRYFAIQINTSLSFASLGYPIGLPVFERYEELMQQETANMPSTLKGGFAVTFRTWHWLKVTKELSQTAVNGIVIGLCLAFPILVVATRNFIVGFFATLSICCSTVCVVGVIPLVGWKLGVLESLNLCLVVGLSVDYVVHLAEAYHLAPQKDRLGRSRDALENLGVSVISGATTTLGASFFMCFAQILFFMQFGLFLFTVIGFSCIFALLGFMTLMALIGPQGDVGSFTQLVRCFKRYCKKDKEPVEKAYDAGTDATGNGSANYLAT